MSQQLIRQPLFRRPLLKLALASLVVCFLAACVPAGGTGFGLTPSATSFSVTSVDLAVSPDNIAGTACGSSINFTYTATFHLAAGNDGGTIQFAYTVNNGRSSTNASVTVSPGETTKTYTFTSSGTLSTDHTYPGIAEVLVSSPNAVQSPQVQPSGSCGAAAAFQVTGVDLAVSPASIAGMACGSSISLTYTATFHLAAGGPGGTIQFEYTLNNGRSSTSDSVTVSPGETSKTYTFTSSGTLPADHTYPGIAEIMVTSPNGVQSPQIQPAGSCGTAAAFQVTSVDMSVSPASIAGMACGAQTTVTYTATFHIAPGGPGGAIQFEYTTNNGRGSANASISVGAGQTSATYSFTWSGKLPADHTYPEGGGVIVTSPNQVNSSLVAPTGSCS